MSKAAKIAITIGLMVVWALLRSLLEYSDFPLPVLTFVFIIIILGIWAFGKTPEASETDRSINRVDSEKQSDVGGTVFSDEKERKAPLPHIQVKSESEPKIAKQIPPKRAPSNMNIDNLNKDYVISLLKEKCHPRQFMQPYDYEKVNIANRLFSSLNDDCSLEDIKGILSEATEKLQVTIDTSQVVAELCKACSPELFMEPYDAEKIATANELYSRILANSSNIIELIKLKGEAIIQGVLVITTDGKESGELQESKSKLEEKHVVYWRSKSGQRIRLSQQSESEVLTLETENGEDWQLLATLKAGNKRPWLFGSKYINCEDPSIRYEIRWINGDLIETNNEVLTNIWKWDTKDNTKSDDLIDLDLDSTIVGEWIHSDGNHIVIINDEIQGQFVLAVGQDNIWHRVSVLKLIKGTLDNYARGASFAEQSDSDFNIVYKISRLGYYPHLKKIADLVVIGKYEPFLKS